MYTVVIARYNENLHWADFIENKVIYNKGEPIPDTIQLKNIGREGETFLYHIVHNYHNLPDYLVLLQGNPFQHTFKHVNYLNLNLIKNLRPKTIEPFFTDYHTEPLDVYKCLKTNEFLEFLNLQPEKERVFAPGCQYIIPKENILKRPLEFYKKIHSMLLNNTIITNEEAHYSDYPVNETTLNPWTFERIFKYLFS
uniref:DUF3431 domain-containing protein n=1 Tax=viral metagenome TaxID=1070528 RepID=A0A6C0AZ08_9ZZZZ